ncbi:MAG: FAD-dependent oxidoreductase [Gammaproteobacteria bacterium AqS3]|nr:FAD-dependent oxidoreductase [Gammaproteobacteria bacterium AqS3]
MSADAAPTGGADIDVAVFGGGIAGLWLARTLQDFGYSVQLLSLGALGAGQTLWAQGIVHGGVKYLLSGRSDPMSEALWKLPERWREHLSGARSPDLGGVRVRCDACYLLSSSRPWSRMRSFLGGRMLAGRVEKLARGERPEALRTVSGALYQLQDLVVDVPSLLAGLSEPLSCWNIEGRPLNLERREPGWCVHVGEASLCTRTLVFAAAAGNIDLSDLAGIAPTPVQRRPLRQIIVRSPGLPEVYTHCIGGGFGAEPELTITAHGSGAERVWSLGGAAATAEGLSDEALIGRARERLAAFLPGLCPPDAEWSVHRVVRVEPDAGGALPDRPYCEWASDDVLIAWPSKLTLAPLLGDMALERLGKALGEPTASDVRVELGMPRASVGAPPWLREAERAAA